MLHYPFSISMEGSRMTTTVTKKEYTGFSDLGITEALKNALQEVGEHTRFEVIETQGSQIGEDKTQYQVTIAAFFD